MAVVFGLLALEARGKEIMTATFETAPPLWRRLVETNAEYFGAVQDFLAPPNDRVLSIRHGLRAGGVELATALRIFPYLSAPERIELFPDLVFLSSSAHGSLGVVRDLTMALPREYVLANLANASEPYLRDGTSDEYRRFLELFWLLDHAMVEQLAKRAANHCDVDIREAGNDFIDKLAEESQ